jgi:predicted PurR-regulated permease PerM
VQRKHIQDAFFVVLLVALSAAFIRLLVPLLVAVVLAVILALVLRHPVSWLTRKGMGRGKATMLIIAALVLVGSGPVFLLTTLIIAEVEEGAQIVRTEWPRLLTWVQSKLPGVRALMEEYQIEERISALIGDAAAQALNASRAIIQSAAGIALHGVVVIYLVIYLLIDGERLIRYIYRLLPLDRAHSRELLHRAANTLDATVLGTLFIGIIEGAFGAALFAIFGFPSPTLWGVVMVIMSVLPLLGINVIIVPAGIIAIILGDVGRGIGLIAVGVAGTVVSQNMIRPKMVGDRAGLHPALVLVSTLGGLVWLGLLGFIVGPVIATLAAILWEQFAVRHEDPNGDGLDGG